MRAVWPGIFWRTWLAVTRTVRGVPSGCGVVDQEAGADGARTVAERLFKLDSRVDQLDRKIHDQRGPLKLDVRTPRPLMRDQDALSSDHGNVLPANKSPHLRA